MRTKTSLTKLIMNESVTAVSRVPTGTYDALGVAQTTESSGSLTGVSVQPLVSAPGNETISQGDQVVWAYKIFTSTPIDLTAYDYFITPLGDFEIDGDVVTWPGSDGNPEHSEAFLKRWVG